MPSATAMAKSRDHHELIFDLVDLDRFKEVKHGYGHDVGDRLLIEIGDRLREIVPESVS